MMYFGSAGKKYRQDKLKNISAMLICLLCMKVIGTKKDLRQHLETAHESEYMNININRASQMRLMCWK